jgi:hypothetical protein
MSQNANRFKSRNHAFQSAQKVWACKSCITWHTPKKPITCTQCGFDDFYYFASKFEAKRFGELDLQRKIGHITELETQVTYPLVVNSMPICKYIADFQYKDLAGNLIVEDTKGHEKAVTDVFKLKRKLMGAIHGIDVKPIYQSRKRK